MGKGGIPSLGLSDNSANFAFGEDMMLVTGGPRLKVWGKKRK